MPVAGPLMPAQARNVAPPVIAATIASPIVMATTTAPDIVAAASTPIVGRSRRGEKEGGRRREWGIEDLQIFKRGEVMRGKGHGWLVWCQNHGPIFAV